MIESTPYWLSLLLGLAFGSLNNVLIQRLPRGESLWRPASRCPACSRRLRPWENIPLLSWIMLRGRCAGCGGWIPLRYPLVEAITALLCLGLALHWPLQPAMWFQLPLMVLLVSLSWIDAEHLRLPNPLVLTLALYGLGGLGLRWLLLRDAPLGGFPTLGQGLLGAATGAGAMLLIATLSRFIFRREGLGLGDLKLMGAVGLFLGPLNSLLAIFMGALAGTLAGLALRVGFGREIPFGPFLALGAVLALHYGDALAAWYIKLLTG